jgi:hypothetical protein
MALVTINRQRPLIGGPLTPRKGSRLGLSPWSRDAIGPADLQALEDRTEALNVVVSTVKRRDGQWMIRVRQNQRYCELVARGPLAICIHGALDDFEALP